MSFIFMYLGNAARGPSNVNSKVSSGILRLITADDLFTRSECRADNLRVG
jgi:hypothetical protein